MFTKFLFKRMSIERRVKFLRKRGIVLGTRIKEGRTVHMYMFRNVFAEITFVDDNPAKEVESFSMVSGLAELNEKLENEIRAGK
jgi:hypothetical protein